MRGDEDGAVAATSTPSTPGGGPRTAADYLRLAGPYLSRHGSSTPRLDAEVLLAHVLGISRLELYMRLDQPLVKGEVDAYREALVRRAKREPVAYITGVKEFYGMPFQVGPGVLIPRPETEFLVELALEYLRRPPASEGAGVSSPGEGGGGAVLVDFGAGSGAIGLAVAARTPGLLVVGIDRSPVALGYARSNGTRLGMAGRCLWVVADCLDPVAGEAAEVVVSNPPYVPAGELLQLAPEISRYEPLEALDGGPDGLQVARRLVAGAHRVLRPGGVLLVELGGASQAQALATWMREAGCFEAYATVEARSDPVSGAVALVAIRAGR